MFETLHEKIFSLMFIVLLVFSVTTVIYSSDKTKYPKIDTPTVLLGAAAITVVLTPLLMLISPIIESLSRYVSDGNQIAVSKQYIFGFVARQYDVFCNEYDAFCDNDTVFHQLDILALAACIIAGLRIALSIGLALLGRPSSLEHVKAMERSGKGPLGYAVWIILPIGGFWLVSYPGAYKSALLIKKLLESHPAVMLIIVALAFVFSVQFLTELILTYICFAVLKARRLC
ncbi:hypothetical protein IYW40_17810 [Methylocystis sp. H4A]|uniref:hypothetical protein n=1 Tax=Methylocystis sp. H4A TaxID=2785788 RepID=UPI0018C2D89E|nr:hypothetical protein [Methylocystis sp. H4A]MBG0803321.1 hypothetical protein [Methylocystis sp. H4A]